MSNQAIIWDFFKEKGLTEHGIAGMMGNIEAESGFLPNNLQNTYNTKFGMTDEAYTTEVDNGTYKNFATDSGGYGICQWTWSTRKQALKDKAKERGTSVGNIYTQMELLWDEINGSYTKTLAVLKTATTVKEASDMFMTDFERPADQSDSAKAKRAAMGEKWYKEFATTEPVAPVVPTQHYGQPFLDEILDQGLITQPRHPEDPVAWGDLAVVACQILKKMEGIKNA